MSSSSKKFTRWCVKHKLIAILVFGFSYAIIFFALFYYVFHASFTSTIIFSLLSFLCVALIVSSAFNVLLTNAAKDLNEKCDVYPLLEETEFLLTCKLSDYNRQLVIIDCCAVRLELGEYQKAFDVISEINIDKHSGMLPPYKIVYYINLSDACIKTGRTEEAQVWHSKLCNIFDDMKANKQKAILQPIIDSQKARMAFVSRDFLSALQIVNSIKPTSIYMAVYNSLLSAKAYMEIGDKSQAVERLKFVIDKGNTLYIVKEAEALLNECMKNETDWL